MKKLKLFFALFAMLALGVGNAWGAEKTITLTYSDFGLTNSYAQKTATVDGIGFTVNQGYKGSGNVIQMNSSKGAGVLYNTTSIAGLKSITVNVSSGSKTYTITSGTAQTPSGNSQTGTATKTFSIPSGDTYFQLKVSGASYFSSIVITYDDSNSGGETPGTGGGSANVTYDFTKIDGFSSWGNSYSSHEVTYSDAKVTFEAASKQTSNITDCPVTKGKSVVLVMTDGSKLSNVKWVCKQWTTKTQTITLYYSTNGGGTYTSTGITSTNFSISSDNLPAGTNAVKITFSSTDNQVGISSCTITKVSSGSTEPTLSVSVSPASYTFATTNVGETATQEFTITAENTTETLSAEISNTTDYAISPIADNKITVTYQPQTAKTHEATLTIKAGDEASATVALTGKAVAALEGTWILVTDASSLKAGDEIIIAAKEYDVALSTTQNNNNRGEVAITKNQNTITATSEAQVLTLQAGKTEGSLALSTGDGYLFAASSGSNYLRTETTLSDNSSWTIAIADGTATLTAQGTYTRNTLFYNSSSKIFSCYASTTTNQQAIAIYKNTNGQQLAGLAYATTKYLTKLGDAFTTPTLTNPNSLTVTYSSSDNNVATVDNTGTITIKAAGVVVITAAFAGDASYLEGSAKYTLCVTEHAGTEADSYSVADARRVIDVMETAEGVYATGIVSEIVTAYNSEYGNITYNISVDGTTDAAQLQAYRGKAKDGADFTSADDIKVGDEVVVKGNLKKYNTTYEFDANNQLVSLKRDKQQAGLAYAETELTANVGEDFTEPTLTNPNSLTVTYSSSNTALATVDATTGEVSILAAGKVTITASSVADATYAAGTASYNITISDPSLAVATLPFAFNGNKAAIETTAGMTQNGLGSDYSASTAPNSQLKFDHTGDWVVICFDSEPEKLSYDIKNNSFSGGIFSVQESADGETYTDVAVHTTITDLQSEEYELNSASRYVKFIYTTKSSGNVGLGNISITKADHRQEAGLAWNPATISLTVDDAFTAPTFSNPNSLTVSFESSNTALATVNNAGEISLVSGKTGTATITATYAGNEFYKAAAVTCVITVSPKSEKVVILAQYNGQWYALKAAYLSGKTDRLDAIHVNYVGGKLYNVAEADKASIEWSCVVEGDKVSFINDGKYLKGKTNTTLLFEEDADGLYQWDNTTYTMTIGTTERSFLYNGEAFRNFAVSNAGKVVNDVLYSSLPVVTAPVYKTGPLYTITATAENGTVIGAGIYEADAEVTLTADPAMDYTFVGWTKGGEVVSIANPFVFKATENLDLVANFQVIGQTTKALTGKFSVGEYKCAEFATGNLQYTNGTWGFAKQQYQYVGEANINVGDHTFTGTIDMFGWSTNDADNNYGVNPNNVNGLYDGTFQDWGDLFSADENWSTLSADQWKYLLNKRTNASSLKQIARVGSVVGIMLFPDNWNAPLTVTAQHDSYFDVDIHNYTLEQWAELEEAGALFLPAAGRRAGGYGNTINKDQEEETNPENLNGGHYKHYDNGNIYCYYWTSTINESTKDVSYLHNIQALGGDKYTIGTGAVWGEKGRYGQSVRLAKVADIPVVIRKELTVGQLGTVCLPYNIPSGQVYGATFYTLEGKMDNKVVFDEVTGELAAGVPYLFQASAEEISCFPGTTIVTEPNNSGAMKGTFVDLELTELSNIYYFAKNALWSCVDLTKLSVPANRAYVNMAEVTAITEAAPVGVRRITLGVNGQNTATGVDQVQGDEVPAKMIINGQLFILRGEKMYDAQGKLVK